MKYLLFVFAKHEKNQEKFVKIIAEDITVVSDSPEVNFYFGPESVIYSFSSNENPKDLKEFFDIFASMRRKISSKSKRRSNKIKMHHQYRQTDGMGKELSITSGLLG